MRRVHPHLLLLALVSLLWTPLHAQFRFPTSTQVNTDAPAQLVPVTLPNGGALASVKVTTQGSEHFDFTSAPGGTCTPGQTYLPGQSCTVFTAFHPQYPGERRGAFVLLDASGAPLATRFLAAQATGAIATFLPATITTVAGDQAWIYAGDGGNALSTSIFLPFGIAVDAAGNLYIADSSNNRIRKVDATTQLVSTVAGTGTLGATGDNGPATAATLADPSSLALDPAGNLYFSDSGNNAIRRIDAFTGVITTVAGTLNSHGYTGDLGPAAAATLNTPNGLAFDSAGNLYFADTGNHAIRLVTAATGVITTVAGRGFPGFSGDAGPATAATLNGPWSVTLAPSGELYIADQNNHRIRKVDLLGNIATVLGDGNAGFKGDKQTAPNVELNVPASVALDVAGNLYVADSGNNRVRKLNAKTGIFDTVAGNSGESISGDGAPADQASLYGPYTLALDSQNNLLIADVFHNRIRRIAGGASTQSFSPIRVGRVSPVPFDQTVENDGNAPMNIAALEAVSNSQVSPTDTTCSISTPLAALDTCVVSVAFAPTVIGNPAQGTVHIVSDAANSPATMTVSGLALNIDPTSLVLAASVNPGITNQPVTLTATATSAGAVPTGSVTFMDGSTPIGTAPLLNDPGTGGVATFTTSALTAGQHILIATYPGDTSNSSAVSAQQTESIKDAQPATVATLISSANPVDAAASLTFTATVSTKAQGSGLNTITGTVTFLDGPLTLGSAPLTNGTPDKASATFSTTALAVGSHTITAYYPGTSDDLPSTSAPLTQVVQIATTKLALSSNANPSITGAPLTLTATILSTGGTPTGAVSFAAGASLLGTASLNGQGVATLQIPAATWAPGTVSITATYAGDLSNSPSLSAALPQLMNLATTAVAVTSALNPAGLGAPVTLSAVVSGNGGTPTGTVQFLDGINLLGTATLNAAGAATITANALTIGTHSITASYSGDTYDAPATSPALTQIVQQTTIALTLASSKNPALFADQVTFTAHIAGSGSRPTGTVTFSDGPTTLAAASLDAAGNAAYTTTALSIGSHPITATYSGDANHSPTTANLTESILQTTTTTLALSTTHTQSGLPVTLRVSIIGTQGLPITGTIIITDGSASIATLVPDASGSAAYIATLAIGSHALSATYSGDSTDAPSTSATSSVLVDLATTTLTLGTSANPAPFGQPVTLTATLTGNGATPAGVILFHDGATVLATQPLTNGTAALRLSTLNPGIHTLQATYSGDSNNQPASSSTVSQQIIQKTGLTITSSSNPSLLTDPVTLTITAANGSATAPTGTVTLADGPNTLTTLTLANGLATYTLTNPALGTHTLTATYSGDTQNAPITAPPFAQVVTLRPSTVSLSASATSLSAGQQLILVSIVNGQGPHAPTGSVTFASGTNILGTASLTPTGVATVSLTPGQANYSITANYSGDSLFAPSTSAAAVVTVGPPVAFTLTPTPASVTLQSGQHVSLSIAVASASTFHDTLAFGCAGLPVDATCTFSTDQLAVTPGLAQAVTVTVDTGNPLGAGSAAALLPLGAILSCFFHRRRRSVALLAAFLTLGLSVTGCGTNFAQSTTPAGAYTFQVVASGTTTTTTQAATIHLTVTQ